MRRPLELDLNVRRENRPELLLACDRALNFVYWTGMLLAMPTTVWLHLIVDYKLVGFVYAAMPLAYLPSAMGWFPQKFEHRFILAGLLVLLLALAINSQYQWQAQPGLYILAVPTFAIYVAYGIRGLLGYATLVALLVGTSSILGEGMGVLSTVISLGLWITAAVAGCSLLKFVIDAADTRSRQLARSNRHLERRENELSELNAAMSRMFAVVSHELRTPASTIHMLANDPDPDPGTDVLGDVRATAEHLLRVIDDLRHAVSPQSGVSIRAEVVQLHELIHEVRSQTAQVCGENSVVVDVIYDAGVEQTLLTDAFRLRTVLINLIRNACLHSGGSRVRLCVGQERAGDGSAQVTFTVADNGRGISGLDGDALFQPFVRGSTGSKGAGLGLYLVKQWVEVLGGSIELTRTDLSGAAFRISLPVVLPGASTALLDEGDPLVEARALLAGRRILLAEDEVMLATLTAKQLVKFFDAQVDTVGSGREALEHLTDTPGFDLILTDYFMPELDGVGLTRALRANGVDVPVVALTAATIGDEQQSLLDAGADAVLAKPLIPMVFAGEIRRLHRIGRLPAPA